MKRFRAWTMAAALLAGCFACSNTEATRSGADASSSSGVGNGVIAYEEFLSGIRFINADGSPATIPGAGSLTGDSASDPVDLAWSPDGRSLAFVRASLLPGPSPIDLFSVATGDLQELTSDSTDGWPTWSPDGSQIAFLRQDAGSIELWVMESDGTDPHRIWRSDPAHRWAPAPNPNMTPAPTTVLLTDLHTPLAWSADGSTFAVGADPFGEPKIELIDAGDGSVIAEVDGGMFPAFSPTEPRLAFDRMLSTDAYGLFVSGADGEDVTPLTEGKGLDVFPAWSPDGSHVAYMSDSGGRRGDLEVWTIAADGSDATKLTDRATEYSGTGTGPSWSPDGQTLLFLDEDFVGAVDFYVATVDAAGGNQKTLTHDESRSPVWQPVPG